ncbi:MAG: pilin [Pseudomonadales bacterium]|nr:pilin [Pseudomonadales bacterium]
MERKTQQIGFTLIEMLIVIAIVGILSAVALPIYQQYIARAQLKEGVSFGMSAQPLIEDYIHRNGSFPATGDLAALGLPVDATSSPAGAIFGSASATIATVITDGTDDLIITLQGDLRPEVQGTIITYTKTAFTVDGSGVVTNPGSWSCDVAFPTGSAAVNMDLMPDGCSL